MIFFPGEVQRKFNNLKKYFAREMRKIRKPSGSPGAGFVPKWEHFSKLEFLNDVVIVMETSSNLERTPKVTLKYR